MVKEDVTYTTFDGDRAYGQRRRVPTKRKPPSALLQEPTYEKIRPHDEHDDQLVDFTAPPPREFERETEPPLLEISPEPPLLDDSIFVQGVIDEPSRSRRVQVQRGNNTVIFTQPRRSGILVSRDSRTGEPRYDSALRSRRSKKRKAPHLSVSDLSSVPPWHWALNGIAATTVNTLSNVKKRKLSKPDYRNSMSLYAGAPDADHPPVTHPVSSFNTTQGIPESRIRR